MDEAMEQLRKQVAFLRDGADYAYKRMLHEDGTESAYAPEHRHFREAYQSVLDIIDGMTS
jgi:hypothetical protein